MDIKYFIQKFFLNYAVLIIIGLLLLVVSLQMQPGFYATVVNQVATALLITGVSSGVYELSLRREFIEMIDKNKKEIMRHEYDNSQTILREVHLIKEKSEVGLKRLRCEASKFSYEELIYKPQVDYTAGTLERLSAAERKKAGETDIDYSWGGRRTVAGSAWNAPSLLEPQEVIELL